MPIAHSQGFRRIKKILRGLWLGVAFIATLEIAARMDDWMKYGAPLTSNYEFDQMFRQSDGIIRGVPYGRYMRWQLNSDGFRGPEIRPDRGQSRVLVYAASEAFGIYEDTGKEFPRELEEQLNYRTSPGTFEVINAGIPGMRIGAGISLMQQ